MHGWAAPRLFRVGLYVGVVVIVGFSVIGAVSVILEKNVRRMQVSLVDEESAHHQLIDNYQDNFLANLSLPDAIRTVSSLDEGVPDAMKFDENVVGSLVIEDATGTAVTPVNQARNLPSTSILLIGGIDGSLTAFNAAGSANHPDGSSSSSSSVPLWSLNGQNPLISSSLSEIKLMKNGLQVQLIPSLDGTLFSYDGDKIEPLPVSADSLLSSSFKISEDAVVTGGKETIVHGLDPLTGKLKYSCGINGCTNQTPETGPFTRPPNHHQGGPPDTPGMTLLLSRLSQTVRAFDVHDGNEKWNFSVGSLDIAVAGKRAKGTRNEGFCGNNPQSIMGGGENEDNVGFRFDVASGVVLAVKKQDGEELWRHQMKFPITSAWLVTDHCVRPLNLVTEFPPVMDPLLSRGQDNQLIYIGKYEEQLFIQRAGRVKDASPVNRGYPQVTFRPLLINAPSRTPLISNAYRPFLHAKPDPNDKAIMPIAPHQYPFDNNDNFYDYPPFNGGFFVSTGNSKPPSKLPLSQEECHVDEESMLMKILKRWQEITGLMLLPMIVSLGWRQYFKRKMKQLQSESDLLKRMNSNTPNSTRSLASVISLQQLQPRHSRFQSDFEVLEQLGKGGFGVVYTARNRLDDNLYAVKKIRLPKSDAAKEKVRREVRVLAKLDHIGIVRFYNCWVEASDPDDENPVITELSDHDHGDHLTVEPTSVSSCTSTDLNCKWIGTQRKQHTNHLEHSVSYPGDGDGLSDSLRLVPADGGTDEDNVVFDEKDESVDVLFEDDEKNEKLNGPPKSDGNSGPPHRLNMKGGPPGNNNHNQRKRSRSSTKKSSPSLSGLSDFDDTSSNNDKDETNNNKIKKKSTPQFFIQMELCRKETLKDWLKINVDMRIRNHVLDIYYQIVGAVDYIHGKGLMHRDLKPSNILFSLDGTAVKVGDFGLVTFTDDEKHHRSELSDGDHNLLSINGDHTDQVGTSLYMSPEQLHGHTYDEKVDIYSLGLILFELLIPFKTDMERIHCLTHAKKLFLNVLHTGNCSQECDEVLLRRLLSVDPSQRPSAGEIRNCDIFTELLILMEDVHGSGGGGMRGRGQSVSLSDFFQKR